MSGFVNDIRNPEKLPLMPVKSVLRDPLNSNGYFLSDDWSIRYFDEAKDEVTLITGGQKRRRRRESSPIITADGKTIWFAEDQTGLQRLNIASRIITTVSRTDRQA